MARRKKSQQESGAGKTKASAKKASPAAKKINKGKNDTRAKATKKPVKKGGRRENEPISETGLDNAMNSYWEKSNNPEILAKIAKEKEDKNRERVEKKMKAMNDVMDDYWAAKKPKEAAPEGEQAAAPEASS